MTEQYFNDMFSVESLPSLDCSMVKIVWSLEYQLKWCADNVSTSCVDACIISHLKFLANFTTSRYKWSAEQLRTMAWLIRKQHPALTMPQFRVFIVGCMAGRFGKFYDKLDSVELCSWLVKWCAEIDNWRRANWETRPRD